jgi:uncharacterized protein YajQ (UPF0234 family)
MPSFDIVSEVPKDEMNNAVDQASRALQSRFDFKGVKTSYELDKSLKFIMVKAEEEFQVKEMQNILYERLGKRGIDIRLLTPEKIETNLAEARIKLLIKEGLEDKLLKKLNQCIKDSKLKVQTAIQGNTLRVTGKNRDDLQEVMALLKKKDEDWDQPLQFNNFREK